MHDYRYYVVNCGYFFVLSVYGLFELWNKSVETAIRISSITCGHGCGHSKRLQREGRNRMMTVADRTRRWSTTGDSLMLSRMSSRRWCWVGCLRVADVESDVVTYRPTPYCVHLDDQRLYDLFHWLIMYHDIGVNELWIFISCVWTLHDSLIALIDAYLYRSSYNY